MSKETDQPSLATWLERYGEALRRAVRRIVPGRLGVDDLDEIEQEVRIRLWRTFEDERKIEHPTSYLHRMTWNATIDALRRRGRRPETSLEAWLEGEGASATAVRTSTPSPEELASRRQLLETVEQCLGELKDDRAQAVRCYLQGFTTLETATLFGWTEARARNLTYRGLHQLRRLLTLRGIHHGLEDIPR